MSSSIGGVVQHVRSRCPCSGVWHLFVFFLQHIKRNIFFADMKFDKPNVVCD